jgi:hypothetical protein
MLRFKTFIAEGVAENTAMADHYEIGTALHVHDNSAARNNQDKDYQSRITQLRQKHHQLGISLPKDVADKSTERAKASGEAYLKSLNDHEGIKPDHIHQVHHTNKGIDKALSDHLGKETTTDRSSNPHDIVITGNRDGSPIIHGASLKATSGTAANVPVKSFDSRSAEENNGGIKTNTATIWQQGRDKAGLGGKTAKEIKLVRHEPEIKQANKETQHASANDHADNFNNAAPHEKISHLLHHFKANPAVDYHYVVGEKGGKSMPHHKIPSVEKIRNAKDIKAVVKNNRVHFEDHEGSEIGYAEHRPTHGSFVSPQVNFKFSTKKK